MNASLAVTAILRGLGALLLLNGCDLQRLLIGIALGWFVVGAPLLGCGGANLLGCRGGHL